MTGYWEQAENKDELERGIFLILPLRYEETAGFGDISVAGEELPFVSGDFIELMNRKCRADGDFVRRFRLNVNIEGPNEGGYSDYGFTAFCILQWRGGSAGLWRTMETAALF